MPDSDLPLGLPAAQPLQLRRFDDHHAARVNILNGVVSALQEKYPVENERYRLELSGLHYKQPNSYSLEEQKKAIIHGDSLHAKLHGTWALIDKASGKPVDTKETVVAHVPWLTERGTLIHNGSEYLISSQFRLKPGVYSRMKDNGILEAHVNVKPGTGPSFRVYMEPETGVFRMAVGQSTLKLYPILRSMGVSDKELRDAWGEELLHKNVEAEDPRAVGRAFAKLVEKPVEEGHPTIVSAAMPELPKAASETPETVKKLQKIVDAHKLKGGYGDVAWDEETGETHLSVGDWHEQEDYAGLEKAIKAVPGVKKFQVEAEIGPPDGWWAVNHGREPKIWHKPKPRDPEQEAAFMASLDGPPLKIVGQTLKEAQAPIGQKTTDRKWKYLWFHGELYTNPPDKEHPDPWVLLKVHKGLPQAAYATLKGEGVDCEPHYDDPHVSVLRGEEVRELIKKYGDQWQGAAKIGQKMRFRLSKIVSLVPGGWPEMDRVWFIEVESPELEEYRKDLGFRNLPLQPKTGNEVRFHVTFAVKPNVASKAAAALTEPPEEGATAPAVKPPGEEGRKILHALQQMELDPDVTESTLGERHVNVTPKMMVRATKKLLGIQKGTEETDDRDSLAYQTLHSPEDFFAERIRRDAGGLGRRMLWHATRKGNLDYVQSGALTPQMHAVLLSSGLAAAAEETNPLELADQHHRVVRTGEGGMSCYSEDTEVLTIEGWKHWGTVVAADELACRVNGRLEFHRPTRLFSGAYRGKLLSADTRVINYAVTPDHRVFVSWDTTTAGHESVRSPFRFRPAFDIHGKRVRHLVSAEPYLGGSRPDKHVLPPAPVDRENAGSARREALELDFLDWVEFLGCYLADGSFRYDGDRHEYRTEVGKVRSLNPGEYATIDAVLRRLGFTYRYEQNRRFIVHGKHLAHYLSKFGKAWTKYVPEYVMRGDIETRKRFFFAITTMDHTAACPGLSFKYMSASPKLAEQVAWLAVSLGYAVHYLTRVNHNRTNPIHVIHISEASESLVYRQHAGLQYRELDYAGTVYCASVPGELVFIRRHGKTMWCGNSLDAVPEEARVVQPSHFGFVDPSRAPESARMGLDSRIAHGALRGSDGQVHAPMLDLKTGKTELVSAAQAVKSVVAFPGEMARTGATARAMVRGKRIENVPKGEVDFELPHHAHMFSGVTNLVPMAGALKGGRLMMGAKFFSQALPLQHSEAPLVQNLSPDGRSFDEIMGEKVGAVRAAKRGVVIGIDKNKVLVREEGGGKREYPLYDNFVFNRRTAIHNTPAVGIGETVEPGALLARSNYTDAKGDTAVGLNLRTAYMPFKGLNYEDAVVISESAAQRLSSEHMFQRTLEKDDRDMEFGKKPFMSVFPAKYVKDQLGRMDEHGVVRPGTVVKKGDPLILGMEKTRFTHTHRGHKPIYTDASETWDHEADGTVTDVSPTKGGGWNVTVKTYLPAQTGDKLAARFGDKGVISEVMPDHQMPHDSQGRPIELCLNPLGVISRGNPAQVYEALLGKIARKTGRAYVVPSFRNGSWIDFVQGELRKNGLSDTEDLTDPSTGTKIPGVLTGERFMMKLHHTAESKGKGRDVGSYTSEGLPAIGSKRIGQMETSALVSHNVMDVLKDAKLVRGQRNDDYWREFRMGNVPASPQTPLVYRKFLASLTGAGINVKKEGNKLNLFALTDKDVDKLSAGEVKAPHTVAGNDLAEIEGGLFDKGLTGGHGGSRWSHVNLDEPTPNPVMEEPTRRLLGMTQKQFEAAISARGGQGIKDALSKMDVDREITRYEDEVKTGARSRRDNAVKCLGYLEAMRTQGYKPEELVMSKVPVLPPGMRPIVPFQGRPLVSDPNYLYRDLMHANQDLKDAKGELGAERAGAERLRLYNAFKAVTGLGDPVQAKTREANVRGLLAHVFGTGGPKTSMFQRRVLSTPVDVVGRAVITPNPQLSMDQVGLPEEKAWTIYRPFITRRLIRRGMPATEAARAVADRHPTAKNALLEEMQARPVLINRAPTLHKYGFMAAWPTLVKGDTLQISPVVTPGFGADFDGDAMNYHVPVSDAAVREAKEKMLPSANLRDVRGFKLHYLPRHEFLLGLYLASTADNRNEPRSFRTRQDALRAYRRGELGLGDRVATLDEGEKKK